MTNVSLPTRTQAVIFRGKATLLQLKRALENLFRDRPRRFSRIDERDRTVIAESITPLWTEKDPGEQILQAGKIQNLRIAVRALNNLQIPANEVFSFWKQVGKTTRGKGYVPGRELREGCIIPNIGGGLCQLSNALYDAALKADFEIIERHAHTQVVAGSLAEQGRDATVFWNYVDLRFKSAYAFQIDAEIDTDNLIIRFRGQRPEVKQLIAISRSRTRKSDETGSCATCGVNDCFRVVKPSKTAHEFGRTAYVVDEYSAEFDDYIRRSRQHRDYLFIPLDGRRFRKSNYRWATSGFAKIKQSVLVTAERSYKSRRLARQGASRQMNLLSMYRKLAESFAEKMPFDCLHLVIQQNLLPFLWQNGHLGGRTFDVLMTALPMRVLQERLDFAKSMHPESTTLADFRADEKLVAAEMKALGQARRIITPHTEIASLFPEKSVLLDWQMPPRKSKNETSNPKSVIVFPAATVGRKGIYTLREAIREMDVRLVILGATIEAPDFWLGFDVESGPAADEWLQKADLVVLPAFVEHKPTRLLAAAANGIPVIATRACGVENVPGITSIDFGTEALRRAIEDILKNDERIPANQSKGQLPRITA
jgi:glycosyltransferase involved in cell wall biosynthesis